jgi:hypothetical protein
MKNRLLLFAAALVLAACSSPKYTYEFSKHNYHAGKKQQLVENTQQPVLASSENSSTIATTEVAVPAVTTLTKETIKNTFKNLSKEDRVALKKEIKKEVKQYLKAVKKSDVKSVNATQAMDKDLKMAAIFGSVGLVLTFLGGVNSVFWVLGVIAIVIGVVFFIKWLSRQ